MADKYMHLAGFPDPLESHVAAGDPHVNVDGNPPTMNAETPAAIAKPEERRGGQRHRAVMRAARLSSCVHKVEGMGVVRNISEGGMLVHSHLSFETGERVAISLLDGDRIEGEVVWRNGTAFGIRFCSWISVERVLAKSLVTDTAMRPRRPRLTINYPILVRSGSYLADARICDISQRGAKIQFNKYLLIDCRVQISKGDLRPATGSVKWQVGDLVGLEFHRTLSLDELSMWTSLQLNTL
ncbi:PilZ domain-containing protein [Sphingorhabdus sp. IMCC26285]|uniref:PilZ domain-containing protein n=1 Tax=Sphingorhabdus profundilacus TaxID=2509718 RepID=A0A6I4M1I3_9SPHN|nr:PilZ domain-containing protein [Sphingorhabdus profundilacus]MVZ98106.1 PilZ domain-containing protein [Sphingorhabdus profundilacus]